LDHITLTHPSSLSRLTLPAAAAHGFPARLGGRWRERPAARTPPSGVVVETADLGVRVSRFGFGASMADGLRRR
jgi:hypothetical protein